MPALMPKFEAKLWTRLNTAATIEETYKSNSKKEDGKSFDFLQLNNLDI